MIDAKQLGQSIITTHKDFRESTDYQKIYERILDITVDAAETIVQCSKHMKTIVDGKKNPKVMKLEDMIQWLTFIDVLTMSKLDSGLFVMTPIDVQLDSIARDAVKMFEGEARSAGVDLQFQLEDSCRTSGVNRVSLDPTRVLQILIVTIPPSAPISIL
jgi:signal transduction histidine kinase